MNFWKLPAFPVALALLPALLLLSCSKQPAAPVTLPPLQPTQAAMPPAPAAPDTSTPKGASLAFANAMVAGDTAGMRSMASGTGSHLFVYYNGLADMVASQHIFTETLKARFGDACDVPVAIEHLGNLPPMPANYDQITEKIDGDTATLVDAAGHPGVKLKKVDGAWKVDLDAADAALPQGAPEKLSVGGQQFAAMKKGFDQATAKIIDGTYTDCKTALDAVMAVINAQQ